MILLCGIPSEAPLRAVIDAAESRGVAHAVLNQREASHSDFTLYQSGNGIEGVLRIRETDIRLENISGVFLRLTDPTQFPELTRPRGRWSAQSSDRTRSAIFHAALTDWLETASCPVLNRISRMASNASKPYQAQHIARAGFKIPETIVTNDPAVVRAFVRLHKRVVFKSTSSIRSIVKELRPSHMRTLDRVRLLPTQFQRFVDGLNIRVHVVGTRVFATEIRTDATDYRYASRENRDVTLRPRRLPKDVAERCLILAQRLGLPFAGIDLIRSADDEYYCLEVNPSPAYNYYEERTGQRISSAVVDYLCERR